MYDGGWDKWTPAESNYGDSGSAARFFKQVDEIVLEEK
jgi:hypothetical protein